MSLYSRAAKVMRPALCSETAMDFLQEADATIAAKDAEIASLREELARVIDPARAIAAHAADAMTAKDMVIGALLDTLRQWQYAEDNNDRDELANARTNRDEALAQVAEVGR